MTPPRPLEAAFAAAFPGRPAGELLEDLRALLARRIQRWDQACFWAVWAAPEGLSVLPRAELLGRLRAADLATHAAAVSALPVRPGRVLVWLESEHADCELAFVDLPPPSRPPPMTASPLHALAPAGVSAPHRGHSYSLGGGHLFRGGLGRRFFP